ncbi:hypothetical protein PTKIN_Ptkin09bG0188100 [Pterospermum kingtungense]
MLITRRVITTYQIEARQIFITRRVSDGKWTDECYRLKKMVSVVCIGGKRSMRRITEYSPWNHQPIGPDNLRKLAEQFQKQAPTFGVSATTIQEEDDDNEVLELVASETLEAASEKG